MFPYLFSGHMIKGQGLNVTFELRYICDTFQNLILKKKLYKISFSTFLQRYSPCLSEIPHISPVEVHWGLLPAVLKGTSRL